MHRDRSIYAVTQNFLSAAANKETHKVNAAEEGVNF